EGAWRAGDRRRAVIEREDVAPRQMRRHGSRVTGNGEDEVLRLTGGEREWPYVEQVAVGPPLDADRVRLLAEVLHVKVSGARLRAGPDRQRREPDVFPRDADPVILDGKRQAGRE